MKTIVQVAAVPVLVAGFAMADETRPVVYPFDVTVGGQKAEMPDFKKVFDFLSKKK